MKAIEKDLRVTLIFAILLSFALVGGIPAIIFGASYGITPLLVIGIICTVAGFYGTPMMWVGLLLVCFVLPAILSEAFALLLRRIGWIRENDLKLDLS